MENFVWLMHAVKYLDKTQYLIDYFTVQPYRK